MAVHKYPLLSGDALVQHLNAYLGTEILDEHDLLSTETTVQVFALLVHNMTGIDVSHNDQEQQSPSGGVSGFSTTTDREKNVALITMALPRLLKAAQVTCPISLIDICSQQVPDRTKRLFDVLSGLVNLLIYRQRIIKPKLASMQAELESFDKKARELRAEAASSRRQVERLRAELESSSGQVASLTRQVDAARAKARSRENELNAEQNSIQELESRRKALEEEAVSQDATAKFMRARKAKLEEQAVASPEGLFHLKSKMEEDVEQRKTLLEARYKRLDEIKSQGRAAKSQLRLSELPRLFDETDQQSQALANKNEQVETINAECGPLEARLRLLGSDVKTKLSTLESLTSSGSTAPTDNAAEKSFSGAANRLNERLASTQARLNGVLTEKREATERTEEALRKQKLSLEGIEAVKTADRAVAQSLIRLAERINNL